MRQGHDVLSLAQSYELFFSCGAVRGRVTSWSLPFIPLGFVPWGLGP